VRIKFKAMIAGAAVIGAVAAAGVAYAAFARNNDVTATGTSEQFNSLTVASTWVGGAQNAALLPGESGAVKLVIDAPASNTVNAQVVSITPKPITASDIQGDPAPGDRNTCAGWLSTATFTPAAGTVVLAKNATGVQVTLSGAVTLSNDATEVCEGMTFSVKWTVRFQATRAAATLGTGNQVTLPL
jgi:hypothetical protein